MKKLILALSIATGMVACNSKPGTVANQQQNTNFDTVGLAQLQASKLQQSNGIIQGPELQTQKVAAAVPPQAQTRTVTHVRTITKYVPVKTSSNSTSSNSTASTSDSRMSTGTSASQGTSTSQGTDNSSPTGMSSESSNTAKAPQKKGISKAAKGAVMGGVVGAIGGAVLDKKNPVMGAVLGGILGGGTGYGVGHGMDKKDGRIPITN